jgi:O-methyltransferase involved in polyketide biosynthesis
MQKDAEPAIDIPVGKTALYTCAERAAETDLPDRIIVDPCSKTLAGV